MDLSRNLFGEDYALGYMWECPDYFHLDGKDVLVFSPQGLAAKEHAYQNIHQSGYLIGEVDWETLTFKETSAFRELDYGFDFYAPQTFEDEQKRRILWGWMGLGDTSPEYSNPTIPRGWQHAATLPRQLSVKNDQLYQQPLPEFQNYETSKSAKKLCFQRNRSTCLSMNWHMSCKLRRKPHCSSSSWGFCKIRLWLMKLVSSRSIMAFLATVVNSAVSRSMN